MLLRVECFLLLPFVRQRSLVPDAYLSPSGILPRPACSWQVSTVLSAAYSFLPNSLSVRPFVSFSPPRLLWPLLTSPYLLETSRIRAKRISVETWFVDSFPSVLAMFTPSCFDPFRASLSIASLPRTSRLFTWFLSIESEFCLRLPPHTLSRRCSCLWLVVRRVNAHLRLSLLSYRPCRAYNGEGGSSVGRP